MRWRTPPTAALAQGHAREGNGSSLGNADSVGVPGGGTGARLSSEACPPHPVSLSRPATLGS